MAFTSPLDIANRAAQILGQARVNDFTSASGKMATESAFAYDKLRLVELESNLWRFATKRVVLRPIGIDSVMWTPPTWAAAQVYAAGTVVTYTPTAGVYSGTTLRWNLSAAETSVLTPDNDPLFHRYAGPLAIDLYNTGTSGAGTTNTVYQVGEVVLIPAAWANGTTYAKNAVVSSGVSLYVSLVANNVGNAVTATTAWALWTSTGRSNNSYGVTISNSPVPLTYPAGYSVYFSLHNSNADNPLSATGTWLSVGGTVVPLLFVYPIAAPTCNVFRLPDAFLKKAPTDPKGGMNSFLGATSGSSPEDWVLESDFIVSSQATIMMRFVADVIDVTDMNPLFCEGLAARIAADLCELLDQSDAKVALMDRRYANQISRARQVNSIEIGPITEVENRYVVVRT